MRVFPLLLEESFWQQGKHRYLHYVYTRANVTNLERFGPGFYLGRLHTKHESGIKTPVSSWIRKLLNPELKVETLYPDTKESEFPCSVNALRLRIS